MQTIEELLRQAHTIPVVSGDPQIVASMVYDAYVAGMKDAKDIFVARLREGDGKES